MQISSLTSKNSKRKFHFLTLSTLVHLCYPFNRCFANWKTNDQIKDKPQHSLIDFHHHEKIVQWPRLQKEFHWNSHLFHLVNLPFSFFDQSQAEKIPKKTKVHCWTICATETTNEWTMMIRKLFLHWPDARFDEETIDNIELFIPVHHYAAMSIVFTSIDLLLILKVIDFYPSREIKSVSTTICPANGNWVCGQSALFLL